MSPCPWLYLRRRRPILPILDRNPGIGKLCRNEWVRLAVLSPDSAEVQVFRDGAFHVYQPQAAHLPRAASSTDWYRGWRDHLEFAEIDAGPAVAEQIRQASEPTDAGVAEPGPGDQRASQDR